MTVMVRTFSSSKLSVVIAAYNEAGSIERCLRALHRQVDYLNEVIVVDNNSSDDTAALVHALGFAEVRVVSEPRQGLVYARNTGMNSASSDIIARVDADTEVQPGWAQAIVTFFADERNHAVWGISGPVGYYDLPLRAAGEAIASFTLVIANTFAGGKRALYGCNHAVRRSAWQIIEPELHMQARIMEDLDITLCIRNHGGDVRTAKGMHVLSSARRLLDSPPAFWRYNVMWPRTYWVNGKYVQAGLITLPMLLTSLAQTIALPLTRAYCPTTRRLSIRRLVQHDMLDKRIIP